MPGHGAVIECSTYIKDYESLTLQKKVETQICIRNMGPLIGNTRSGSEILAELQAFKFERSTSFFGSRRTHKKSRGNHFSGVFADCLVIALRFQLRLKYDPLFRLGSCILVHFRLGLANSLLVICLFFSGQQ